METEVKRYIALYEKTGSAYLGKIELLGNCLAELKRIFSPPGSDPLMYNCYEVDESKASEISRTFGVDLYLDKYSYYVEAEEA